jgi:apolipoprotein D and lipocalin family protein
MKTKILSALAAITFAFSSIASAQTAGAEANTGFTRWEGRWFEIARLANWPQRNCGPDVAATFLRRTDGNISVIHQCRTPDGSWEMDVGEGRFEQDGPAQTLGVRFTSLWYTAPPFTFGGYYALALDLEARYVIFGSTDRDHLWILSQTRTIDDAIYQRAVAQAAALGYDTANLIRTAAK